MNPLQEYIHLTRREFLTTAASGLGGLALSTLLAENVFAGPSATPKPVNPLAPKPPHFPPRARNCIFIFLSGGFSHIDLFDPKPKLNELNGQPVPEAMLKGVRFAFIQKDSARIMGTPRTFKKYGA
ncbi:MAG: DUF1501 domain-containing protein, partial [Verrucomicrobia bacterium]|nr:DUF1501 domain-containing protein [Verrucomicrobiota bacterium]